MTISVKHIVGSWFAIGCFIGVIVFFALFHASVVGTLFVLCGLITALCAGYYFGIQWGMLIMELDSSLNSALLAMLYGVIVGICALYVILSALTLWSYLHTRLLDTFGRGDYLQIPFDVLLLPFLSLLATIMGITLEPIIVLGFSSVGGLLLYLLRRKILNWVANQREF